MTDIVEDRCGGSACLWVKHWAGIKQTGAGLYLSTLFRSSSLATSWLQLRTSLRHELDNDLNISLLDIFNLETCCYLLYVSHAAVYKPVQSLRSLLSFLSGFHSDLSTTRTCRNCRNDYYASSKWFAFLLEYSWNLADWSVAVKGYVFHWFHKQAELQLRGLLEHTWMKFGGCMYPDMYTDLQKSLLRPQAKLNRKSAILNWFFCYLHVYFSKLLLWKSLRVLSTPLGSKAIKIFCFGVTVWAWRSGHFNVSP